MFGSRDPLGGQTILSGDAYDALGRPFGFLKALALFAAVTVVLMGTVLGFERAIGPFVPSWAVLPLVVVAFGIVVVGGTSLVFRAGTRLRR